MNHTSSEEKTDVSDSELPEKVDSCHEEIKQGKQSLEISGEIYTGCPFCPGKKKHEYICKDLLQHATGVGNGSKNDVSGREKHLEFAKYLEKDLAPAPSEGKLPFIFQGPDEVFVYPWCGIVVNIQTQLKGGTQVERENVGVKRDLAARGFKSVKVIHVWNFHGHTGKALVEFRTGLTGFYDAMCSEKAFVASRHGKSDWEATTHHSSGTYGWIARDDDRKMPSEIGEKLFSKRNLFTIAELQAGEERKTSLLVADCNRRIDLMDKPPSTEVDCKFNETTLSQKHSKEKEMLRERVLELEIQLEAKQALEVEVENLKGTLREMPHMVSGVEENAEVKKDMDELSKTLKEKEEELEGVADIFEHWEIHKRKR